MKIVRPVAGRRYRAFATVVLVLVISPMLLSGLGSLFFPLPQSALHPPASVIVFDRDGEPLRIFTAPDDMWRIPAPLEEVSPQLLKAVVTVEDRWFRYHMGVNPVSVVRAAVTNIRAGEVVTGGSTLTMQVARLLEPKPRTIRAKIIEVVRALQLELTFSKDEILELYFNLAPYGGNIVGSAAASYFYFDKHQKDLTLGEAALLAAIPNSPEAFRPDGEVGGAGQGRKKILDRLVQRGAIGKREYFEAMSEPVPNSRFPVPFKAPHLARDLMQRSPACERIRTTVDTRIQTLIQKMTEDYMAPLKKKGVSQAAVVVIDTRTRQVLGLVGSTGFFDEEADGQVNGALAARSPGSTLKPFVYALAMDRGLVSPLSILMDVPVNYSGFRPLNYDEKYRGVVSVEDALTLSLNVPAVNLTAQLGEEGVYSFLKQAGVSTLRQPREYYGLSLILGGCEVTLLELTSIYAGLANMGEFAPCRLLIDQPETRPRRLIGEAAAFIITEMLTGLKRPDFPNSWESTVDLPRVAWKTGTSYGHRDAWSVGYSPRFTIGVWVGNYNGAGSPLLVGAEAAGPLLFSIFNALTRQVENLWYAKPDSLAEREVCALTGMVLSTHCPSVRNEYWIPGKSPHMTCTVHKVFTVDKETGSRLCSRCRPGREYDTKVFEVWPPEIATWMERNGMDVDRIPEHFAGCPEIVDDGVPVIHSPVDKSQYVIRDGVSLEHQKILLEASVSNSIRRLYWFVDSKLVFQGSPTDRFFLMPARGKHTLTCMDEEGRSSQVTMTVR